LPVLTLEQAQRIAALRSRYQVQFESQMNAATSVNNYEYLDMLDRAWASSGTPRPAGGVLCDVGCASFWYAAALHAFFRPRRLIGVEVEGHRLFRDGRARIDYAVGYVAQVPTAILAWRLPLALLQPQRLFRQIHHNLGPNGLFVMVNHGPAEAALAVDLCNAVGLELVWRWMQRDDHAPAWPERRASPPVISCWRQGGP
jgi:hypothetical protein